MDKERFIELCKAGDEYALGLLYTNYAPRMKRLCQRYVGDEATAEDIVHDGFIIIMSRIRQLKDAAKLDSWMAAIMRNLAIRYLSQKGKPIFIPIEVVEENEDFACETMEHPCRPRPQPIQRPFKMRTRRKKSEALSCPI